MRHFNARALNLLPWRASHSRLLATLSEPKPSRWKRNVKGVTALAGIGAFSYYVVAQVHPQVFVDYPALDFREEAYAASVKASVSAQAAIKEIWDTCDFTGQLGTLGVPGFESPEQRAARETAEKEYAEKAEMQALLTGLEEEVALVGPADVTEGIRQAFCAAEMKVSSDNEFLIAIKQRITNFDWLACVEDCRFRYKAAIQQLHEASKDEASNIDILRKAAVEISQVIDRLRSIKAELPEEGEEVYETCAAITRAHRAELRREAAEDAVNKAIDSRKSELCSEAHAEAAACGVQNRYQMDLCQVLAHPEQILQVLTMEGGILERNPHFRNGLNIADFKDAANAATENAEQAALMEHAAELVRATVYHSNRLAAQTEACLAAAEAELLATSAVREQRRFADFIKEKDEAWSKAENDLRDSQPKHLDELREKTRAELIEMYEAQLAELHEEADMNLANQTALITNDMEDKVNVLQDPLQTLEQLREKKQTPVAQSQSSISVSSALVALQGALGEGREVYEELSVLREIGDDVDRFISEVLNFVPGEVVDWSHGPVPTEPQLKEEFMRNFQVCITEAFKPTQFGFWSTVVGMTFAKLYNIVDAGCATLDSFARVNEDRAVTSVHLQRNLEALSLAHHHIVNGNLPAALQLLEDKLTGNCRERAADWMLQTRNALVLQQAARVVQAKVRCINRMLV